MKLNKFIITGFLVLGAACTPSERVADLVVLDRNLFELDQADIPDTRVLLTLMEGKAVYGDLSKL